MSGGDTMVTVGEIVGGGFRLVRERIGAVLVWASLYLAMNVLLAVSMRPMLQQMAIAQRAGNFAAAPQAVLASMGQIYAVNFCALVFVIVLYAAGLRAAVRPQEARFAFLRVGFDELRLLALIVGLIILFGAVFTVVVVALVAIVGLLSLGSGLVAGVVATPLTLGVFAALLYVQVRVSLVFPLTLLRRRIALSEAWALSKGHFWVLFGAYLVVAVILLAVFVAVGTVTMGPYLAQLASGHVTPDAMRLAQQHQLDRPFDSLTIFGWVLSAIAGALWVALGAGVAGAATTGLLRADFADIGSIYE